MDYPYYNQKHKVCQIYDQKQSRCARQISDAPTEISELAPAAAATAATVVDLSATAVAATARVTATVVFKQQHDTDDEQDPRPSTVLAAEKIGQTHNKFLLYSLPVGEDYTPYYVKRYDVVTQKENIIKPTENKRKPKKYSDILKKLQGKR